MQDRFLRLPLCGLLALAIVRFAPIAAASPVEDLIQALTPYLPVDTQRIERAALEAALRSIDARAAFIPKRQPGTNETAQPLLESQERWPEDVVQFVVNGLYADQAANLAGMRNLLTPTPAGVILDLRGAGGDSLDALDATAGLFFEDGTPLYELRDGYGNSTTARCARAAAPPPALPPIMVLINGETHGLGEAFAAILRGHTGVMLLGSPTRGDSAWRTTLPWSETEDLLVSTGWIVPVGSPDYFHSGVIPHIAVSNHPPPVVAAGQPPPARGSATHASPPGAAASTNAADVAAAAIAARVGNDLVLRRAVDVLLGLRALRQP